MGDELIIAFLRFNHLSVGWKSLTRILTTRPTEIVLRLASLTIAAEPLYLSPLQIQCWFFSQQFIYLVLTCALSFQWLGSLQM